MMERDRRIVFISFVLGTTTPHVIMYIQSHSLSTTRLEWFTKPHTQQKNIYGEAGSEKLSCHEK